jgi:hypothetical protein
LKLLLEDLCPHRYRPRAEGLFARIERWTRATAACIGARVRRTIS